MSSGAPSSKREIPKHYFSSKLSTSKEFLPPTKYLSIRLPTHHYSPPQPQKSSPKPTSQNQSHYQNQNLFLQPPPLTTLKIPPIRRPPLSKIRKSHDLNNQRSPARKMLRPLPSSRLSIILLPSKPSFTPRIIHCRDYILPKFCIYLECSVLERPRRAR